MSQFNLLLLGCGLLPVGIFGCAMLGHRLGRQRMAANSKDELSTAIIDAAVLSLLGLLTAFAFSGAYGRFDSRRQLIVEEANAIGTAYLRLDLLPAVAQSPLREKFRDYVQVRYDLWTVLRDRNAALAKYEDSERLQDEIWVAAVSATQNEQHGDARKLLLPALNEMIDITTKRLVAVQSHPPLMIFVFLWLLWLAAGCIVGYSMSKSPQLSVIHVLGFAAVATLSMYMIVDIEFPRYGLVTLDEAHELLRELGERFG